MVIGCVADNMRLPFPSNYFDAYIANLSLMLVEKPELQIQESYRVLQPNSKACFTIPGRPENCVQTTILAEALANLKHDTPQGLLQTFTSADTQKTKELFLKSGYNEVKLWFQAANWLYRDGKEYVEKFMAGYSPQYMGDKEIVDQVIRLFDTKYKEKMNTFELLVIVAYKD